VKKYWEDAFVFDFDASVRDVIREPGRLGVVLEETYFYPEGGGQPADRGLLGGLAVSDVQEVDEKIIHYLPRSAQSEDLFQRGSRVRAEIDRDYRINNMRLHTTCHLLFGAARRLFGEVGYAGFNIGAVGNLYLETPRQIRSDDLLQMARLANEVVVEDRAVSAHFVTADEARKMPGLAVNFEIGGGDVRIITVDGWDVAACSGTHMRRTVELGPIKLIAREVHKKNVTRIDYAVGKRSVEEMTRDEKALVETAELLSTSRDQVTQVVRKLSGDLQAAQKDLRKMRERLMEIRASELRIAGGEPVEGITLISDVVDYLDAAAVKALATRLLSGATRTVVAIVGGTDTLSLAAGCSADLNLPLAAPVVAVAKKYGGGGGGKPTFVTAGGIQWSAAGLLAEVRQALAQCIADNPNRGG
jgi:alanyl-tRNA synthetase